MDSYDIRFWDIKKIGNGTGARFRVRWAVNGREHCRSFKARPLADGFLTELKDAVRDRRPFDLRTGLPEAEVTEDEAVTWYAHARACNTLEVWKLAGDGWRSVLVDRLEGLQELRNRRLNSPRTQQVNDLFRETLGIENISGSWHWASINPERAAAKLDEYIVIRHEVAHRGSSTDRIWKYDINDYYTHVWNLVERTAAEVASVLADATGVTPWPDEAAPSGEER